MYMLYMLRNVGYFIHPKERVMSPMKLDLTVSYPKVEKIIIKLKNGNIDE